MQVEYTPVRTSKKRQYPFIEIPHPIDWIDIFENQIAAPRDKISEVAKLCSQIEYLLKRGIAGDIILICTHINYDMSFPSKTNLNINYDIDHLNILQNGLCAILSESLLNILRIAFFYVSSIIYKIPIMV